MALTSETNRVQYNGDGATTAFAVSFVFWDSDDLEVILTDANGVETTWVRGTQYTVSGGNGSTGTVNVETSPTDYTPAAGETLTILSNLTDTQDTTLPAGGPFPSASVEQQLDKIVRMLQQKAEALSRSIKLKISSTFSELEIPDPSASKFLRWNSAANALENADITGDGNIGTPVSLADGGTNADLSSPTALTIPRINSGGTALELRTPAQTVDDISAHKQGSHTIWVPAAAMVARTTNGAAAGTTELATNDIMLKTFDFDGSTSEGVQFMIGMPKSWDEGTVTFIPYWTGAAGAGGVSFSMRAVAVSDDDTLDTSLGSEQNSDDTFLAANDLHIGPESSAITIGGTPAESDVVVFEVFRDVSDANDTKSEDAKLIGVKVIITTDAGDDS